MNRPFHKQICRKIFLSYSIAAIAAAIHVNAIAAEPESSTSENEPAVTPVVTSDIDNNQSDGNNTEAENTENDDSFIPTVQISEDLSVSFPVNI